jgi:ankyrin repeat protein
MSKQLPPNPNLEYDKKQAKTLHKAYRAGDAAALEQVREFHPRLQNVPEKSIPAAEFKLSDAQLVIAREYGFSSWPQLKHHIETVRLGLKESFDQFAHAVQRGDATRTRELLQSTPGLAKHINDPVIDFDAPAIGVAAGCSRELVDVLLEHGADVNAKSAWWAGAFGVLHGRDADMARYLIERGAVVDVHAATEQGMLDTLRNLIEADPTLVNAKGPDGQRPLHFARSRDMIDYLLEQGADIDARDVDHCGTAAQWLLGDHPDLSRYLIERGAQADIFMAAALGDEKLVHALLDADPEVVNKRTGGDDYPPVPPAPGLHIYAYSLGRGKSVHLIARHFGHNAIYQLLLERSSPKRRFLDACERGDAETAQTLLRSVHKLVESLTADEQTLLVDAAWEHQVAAVRVMLDAGFDPQIKGREEMTPLHCAAFHGFIDVVNLLLPHKPSLTALNQYGGTPLGTAIYGATHSWRHDGDFPATIEALLQAGSLIDPNQQLSGNAAVDAVLRRYLPGDGTKS